MAGETRIALIGDGLGREADPDEQALHEAVLFAQLEQGIESATTEEPKIAGVQRQADATDALHAAIEQMRGGFF